MHPLIGKLLKKRGIEDPQELDSEELQTFEQWQTILGKDELTTKEIRQFCSTQIEAIESKWKNFETDNAKKAELIPYHTVYKLMIAVIDGPKAAREALEKHLQQLIDTQRSN